MILRLYNENSKSAALKYTRFFNRRATEVRGLICSCRIENLSSFSAPLWLKFKVRWINDTRDFHEPQRFLIPFNVLWKKNRIGNFHFFSLRLCGKKTHSSLNSRSMIFSCTSEPHRSQVFSVGRRIDNTNSFSAPLWLKNTLKVSWIQWTRDF